MDKDQKNQHFLLKDRLSQINERFTKNGWITVYASETSSDLDRGLIYCGLLKSERQDDYLKTNEWKINLGSEGKPSILSGGYGFEDTEVYYSTNPYDLEPMIFHKSFSFTSGSETYIDVGEEFILYFKLYERGTNKQNRKYFFIDDGGELEEVIVVEPNAVKVKLKYLSEYLNLRKLYLSVCFDFQRLALTEQIGDGKSEQIVKYVGDSFNYDHLIRPVPGSETQSQSSIHGKILIKYDESKRLVSHFNRAYDFEMFKIGYDENGDEISVLCNNEWFGDRYVFFKKEVLNKYHSDPGRYTVDRFSISSAFFNITLDNDLSDKVAVRLRDLMSLPQKEQIYWKSFNIITDENVSTSFYETMFEGNWDADVQSPDLHFKEVYQEFNDKWNNKYGWHLFKALGNENLHHFTSLHVPTTNNKKEFLSQMLSLVIVTIDSLNEKFLPKDPLRTDQSGNKLKWGSIDALDAFLTIEKVDAKEIIQFLRELQKLRSKVGAAHRVSTGDQKTVAAIKQYFDMNSDNYVDVAKEVFTKMVRLLETLQTTLLESNDYADPTIE